MSMSTGLLVSRQNPDGGWPYIRGNSWTEPTVYAVMALLEGGEMAPANRGLEWIRRMQRADGGWPPQPGVDQSMWVTALVALLPAEFLGEAVHARAIAWLAGTTGQETTARYRLREWLLGKSHPAEPPGWPWVPGTAAWVVPTALATLALEKELRRKQSPAIASRVDGGRRFLLYRMCQEGGWSNGSGLRPYPETTGVALAGLKGVRSPRVDASIEIAKRFLTDCHSADALNWLRLGLISHGQLPAGFCVPAQVAFRTVPETSLNLMVTAAARNQQVLWG